MNIQVDVCKMVKFNLSTNVVDTNARALEFNKIVIN